jgi:hypothetical protein
MKKLQILFVGFLGYHSQYKIVNWDILEEYRVKNVMTKKDLAKDIGIGLRTYENITYDKTISIRCAKKVKNFIMKELL